jgi:hypothetical protein
MAEPKPPQSPDPFDFSSLMRTGLDPRESYDKSTFDPFRYDSGRHFKNRISREDAASAGIADAYDGFEANRGRLICLAHLPTEAFLYAMRFKKLREQVNQGNLPKEGPYFVDHPANSLFSPLSKALRDCIDGKREFPVLSEEDLASYHHVSGMAKLGNPEFIGPSIDAFAASVLSHCWQAFEVLAEDLLNDAVSHNQSLFTNVDLPIEIFGLNKKDSAIRVKYPSIFGESAKGILTALGDQHLDYIFAIRNLFAHKSGKTDQIFLKRMQNLILDKIIRPNVGERFPLTGGMVNELGNHCFSRGYYLIREVYLWLNQ